MSFINFSISFLIWGEEGRERFLVIYDMIYSLDTKNIVIELELNGISISN